LGALEAILGSGNLELLDDPGLIVELTSFPALVATLDREQMRLGEDMQELFAYFRSVGVDHSDLHYGVAYPWETRRTQAYTLVNDPSLRGLLDQIYVKYRNTSRGLQTIQEALGRIDDRLAARSVGR
jgi:hypothetical protein